MTDRNAFIVGLSSFLMILAISALLIWKSSIFLKATGYQVVGSFENVGRLLKGAEVRYRGFKVGKVFEIAPGEHETKVYFWIEDHISVPKGSKLRVVFDGIIGEKYMGIVPNTESKEMIEEGDVLTGYATSSLADFVDVGTQNLQETKKILSSLRSVLTDPNVNMAMKNVFIKLEQITDDLARFTESTRSEELNVMMKNLANASADLAELSASLKGVAKDVEERELIDKFDKTLTNFSNFSETVGGEKLKIHTLADIAYTPAEERGFYNANFQLQFDESFFRLGFGDRTGDTKLLHIQQGLKMSDKLTTRLGLFYNEPGVGFDYQLMEKLGISLEVYDLENTEFDFITRYAIGKNVDFMLDLYKGENSDTYDNLGIGFSYKP